MVALFMILTLLCFLAIDYVLQRKKRLRESALPSPVPVRDRFLVPRGYFFSPNHSWIELLSSGKARIGLDDFSQKVVGAIDDIEIRPVQSAIRRGEPLLVLRQGARTLTVTSPVSGRMVEVNEELKDHPSLLHDDPYVNGWVALIEPENFATELKSFAIADETVRWLRKDIARFRDFIRAHTPQTAYASAGMTMADGGVPVTGVMASVDDETWKSFELEFLSNR